MGGGNRVDCFADVEMLDLAVGRWIRTQSMLQKRMALAAVELKGVLYATGGYDGNSYLKYVLGGFDGDSLVQSVESFDPRLGSWMPAEPMYFPRGYPAAAIVEDTMYVIGGMKDDENIAEAVEYYYEGQDWREMATVTIGKRCFMSAAAFST
ncbi:uncharacterized protein [Pyrus communis]|uniref:uncharacterized protein n=1 Tax=Pyrus communis TaxID=23211 RepID=UPI0035C0AC23